MQKHGFQPNESAFTRTALTNIAKVSTLDLKVWVLMLLALATTLAFASVPAEGRGERSSNGDIERAWQQAHPTERLHNNQPRPDANAAGNPIVQESQPAPDRTQVNNYHVQINLQKQKNRNQAGGNQGNMGWQGVFNREQGKHPGTPLGNRNVGQISDLVVETMNQIGNAPNQAMHNAVADMQGQQQGAGDAGQNAACNALEDYIPMIIAGNVNVANEATGTTGDTRAPFRPLSQAIGMVQAMYRNCYLPIALLLLLPGAVLLQMKLMIQQWATMDEDGQGGPFGHILRAMIALFLIPSTQLIMSYSIDVGNSMTYSIAQLFTANELVQWAIQQQEAKEQAGQQQDGMDPQPYADQTMQMAAGMINMSLGYGLLILAAFQLALSCYLFLMGPIAAALYAWPGSVGKLFKPIFINWVNAVVTLSLWRFWWILICFTMVTRIQWLREIGEYVPNTEWEALMLGCFLVMMMYVPFAPFDIKPGELVDKLLEKGKEISSSGAGGGRAGGAPSASGKA